MSGVLHGQHISQPGGSPFLMSPQISGPHKSHAPYKPRTHLKGRRTVPGPADYKYPFCRVLLWGLLCFCQGSTRHSCSQPKYGTILTLEDVEGKGGQGTTSRQSSPVELLAFSSFHRGSFSRSTKNVFMEGVFPVNEKSLEARGEN